MAEIGPVVKARFPQTCGLEFVASHPFALIFIQIRNDGIWRKIDNRSLKTEEITAKR